MQYPAWHKQVVKTIRPVSEFRRYLSVLLLGMGLFGLTYFYISSQHTPNPLNKAVADTSIILIGLSMLFSSICYFWNFLDSKIIYRKHLGLIGFAFGLVHIGLSFSSLQKLFVLDTWQKNAYWPFLTGFVAALIFTGMALISNRYAATHLGGIIWRRVLRTGYFALLLVLVHVVLLKSARWITWYQGGMKTLPSTSVIVSAVIVIVILMRVMLWLSLKKHAKS